MFLLLAWLIQEILEAVLVFSRIRKNQNEIIKQQSHLVGESLKVEFKVKDCKTLINSCYLR